MGFMDDFKKGYAEGMKGSHETGFKLRLDIEALKDRVKEKLHFKKI